MLANYCPKSSKILTFLKTLIFFINDDRWKNLRDYYTDEYGNKLVTFVFGIFISMLCPLFFVIQNIILGLCINGGLNLEKLKPVFMSTKSQIIVIYDMTLTPFFSFFPG